MSATPIPPPPPPPPPALATTPAPPTPESADETGRLLRPYAVTGGRTSAPASLVLESQLRRTDVGGDGTVHRWEAARIIEMAARPIALIEVAARVRLPVGVAKVVVADLIEQGALTTGQRPPESSFSSLLERVLDGLDRL